MRGVDLSGLLDMARKGTGEDLPPLAYGASEEPILFPEGEEGDLENILTPGQSRRLLGVMSSQVEVAVQRALQVYIESDGEEEPASQEAQEA